MKFAWKVQGPVLLFGGGAAKVAGATMHVVDTFLQQHPPLLTGNGTMKPANRLQIWLMKPLSSWAMSCGWAPCWGGGWVTSHTCKRCSRPSNPSVL